MSRRPFTTFEVHLVGEYQQPGQDDPYCETIDTLEEYENDDSRRDVYYTVYGYRTWESEPDRWGQTTQLDDGGASAIADFPKYEDALDLAYALADGKDVIDMVPVGLEHVNQEERIH